MKVGVVGGGRMGAGIAQVFAQSGSAVVVVERDDAAASAARERLATGAQRAAEKGLLTSPISVSCDMETLAGCELVIEAVPEDARLKAEALARMASVCDGWIATNTSSLSVTELAAAVDRPERFAGLHFFNPVPSSALVEIVVAGQTAPEFADLARDWVEELGKTPIVVRDSPGFASSRLGLVLGLEAMRMVEEGVASPADIDTAMELGYRHAMGPLRTSDLVGLDVRLGIAEYLATTLGPRFEPPIILRDMVARGHLGRKSGEGFFTY